MRTSIARRAGFSAMLALAVVLGACEAKVTKENYDQIDTGMSLAQVRKLLGGSGVDETPSGTSITGAGIADSRSVKVEVYRWRDGNRHIVVTFKDGKVFEKVQEGL
ncbi:MAG: hypothetical protein AB7K52_03735 [Phycisphaerales bacterium]